MNIVEPFVRQALSDPARIALFVGGQQVSYGALLASVRHIAARLLEIGVVPGDRVGVTVAADGGNIAATLGIAYLGAVSVALRLPNNPNPAMLRQWDVRFLVHSATQDVQALSGSVKAAVALEELLREKTKAPPPPVAAVASDQVWRIVLSSGTTGTPKAIALAHHASLMNVHLQFGFFPLGPDDRVLLGMGVSLGFATHQWMRCLHRGSAVVLPGQMAPQGMLDLLYAYPISIVVGGPGLALALAELCEKMEPSKARPGALRRLHFGGGKIAPRVRNVLAERLCPHIFSQYGASETSGAAVTTAQTEALVPGSAGMLYPWVEAQAVDAQGNVLPAGQVGLLRFRSPTLAAGYVGDTPPPPTGFRDGWFQSNDTGAVTPHGILLLAGRADDMINVLGNKVDPERIERAIQEDTAVRDCVVLELPGENGMGVLTAAVIAPDGFDQEAMLARCAALHPAYQPRMVVTVDMIPRNEAGKIMRAEVRKRLMAALAQRPQGVTLQ